MSWVLAITGFALLIILHEAGHFLAAKAVGMRAEKFYLFFPPKLVSFRRGETEYGIGAIPLGGYVKITGMNPEEDIPPEVRPRAYYEQPVWKRIVVIAAGPAVNIALALIIFFVLSAGIGLPVGVTNTIADTDPDLPAASVLEPGDELLSIDGKDVTGLDGIRLTEVVRSQVGNHVCAGEPEVGCEAKTPVVLGIERDGQRQTVRITPVYESTPTPDGGTEERMLIGVNGYEEIYDTQSVGNSIDYAFDRAWLITSRTAEVFGGILEKENRDQINSVVGASKVTEQSFAVDTRQALFVLGVISLSLGLINLLPFLPLDGGHIFWALVEKIRGKRVPFSVMEKSGVIGFALVMVIFAIGLSNDISRLTDGGFDVR